MMNRRQAIAVISIAAFGAELPKTPDNTLSADIARIGSRTYSEEGVPMFLACVNLAAHGTAPKPSSSPLNRKVESAFHRDATQWQQIRPDAPASDVAKILELIADRDFSSGGTEASL